MPIVSEESFVGYVSPNEGMEACRLCEAAVVAIQGAYESSPELQREKMEETLHIVGNRMHRIFGACPPLCYPAILIQSMWNPEDFG